MDKVVLVQVANRQVKIVINAKIIDNQPICGYCKSNNISGIRDYKQIEMNDKNYVMFQFRCYSCNQDNKYLADVMLDGTIRYEINGNIKEVE